MIPGVPFFGVRRLDLEADYSSRSGIEFKNEFSCISTSPICFLVYTWTTYFTVRLIYTHYKVRGNSSGSCCTSSNNGDDRDGEVSDAAISKHSSNRGINLCLCFLPQVDCH